MFFHFLGTAPDLWARAAIRVNVKGQALTPLANVSLVLGLHSASNPHSFVTPSLSLGNSALPTLSLALPEVMPSAPRPVPQASTALQTARRVPKSFSVIRKNVNTQLKSPGLQPDASSSSSRTAGNKIFAALLGRKIPDSVAVVAAHVSPRASSLHRNAADSASRAAPPSPTDEKIFADLRENPPSAVFFDYDKTLVDTGPDGLSLPPSPEVLKGLIRLLEAGLPVGIVTARNLDRKGKEGSIPDNIWEPLIQHIPARLRRNLFFAGRLGGEIAIFNNQGKIIRIMDSAWGPREVEAITDSLKYTFASTGVSKHDVIISESPSRTYIKFEKGLDRAEDFADALNRNFRKKRLGIEVVRDGSWVYYSRFKKQEGIRLVYTAMRSKGFTLQEENLVIVGDDFSLPLGGDASLARGFPASRAISVDYKAGDRMPDNVQPLSIKSGQASQKIMEAILAGLKKNPPTGSILRKARTRRQVINFALGAAAAISLPWLASHIGVTAAIGSAILSVIGIPQIIRNFRKGREATKDLAPGSYSIWLAAATLLTVVSIGNGTSLVWTLANVAGIVMSMIVIGQLNYYNRDTRTRRMTLASLLLSAGFSALAYHSLWFSPATWISLAFMGAMALLWVLNIPQIRANYFLYQKEARPPKGVQPLYPALVVAGSLFHLYAAIALGDLMWAGNAIVGIITAGIVVLQIFAPKWTNRRIRLFFPRREFP